MVDVNDPHNYERRIEKELANLRRAAGLDDEDGKTDNLAGAVATEDASEDDETNNVTVETYEAVEEFVKAHRKGRVPDSDELSPASLTTYLKYLRYVATDTDGSLLDAQKDDLVDYLEIIGYENSASYHNANISALYAFSDYHDLGWREYDFDFIITDVSKVDPDRLFSDEEVNGMLDEGDARGRAKVALLADTASRIGALASFRIRDLDLGGDFPQLAFNTDSNVKSAEGKILLSWSVGHLETYLNTEHPRPDEPNAPVIHKKRQYDEDKPKTAAVSPSRLRKELKDIGEAAGLVRDRVRPHNFRHTAVSNWIRQGYQPDEIVHMASWASVDMLEIYDNVTDEQRNEDLAVKMGLVEDEDLATKPEEATIPCPRCESPVRRNSNFCGSCGLQMSRAPAFRDEPESAKIGAEADEETTPGIPDDVWADGAGDMLDEVPPDVLVQKLVEKTDVDVSDLLKDSSE